MIYEIAKKKKKNETHNNQKTNIIYNGLYNVLLLIYIPNFLLGEIGEQI